MAEHKSKGRRVTPAANAPYAATMRHRRKPRALSDAEEVRIQAGIAADPENPEWSEQDFRRAKPFVKAFPALAKSRRARGRKSNT